MWLILQQAVDADRNRTPAQNEFGDWSTVYVGLHVCA